MENSRQYDVIVIGGGNAGICAALTAREAGASVLVLEAAPIDYRGGNSRHTRNFRCMHEQPADVLTDTYPESEYWEDLRKVTAGRTNEELARTVIRGTAGCRDWMRTHGVRFQPSLGGTLHLSRTNAFFLGGGKALINAYYRSAARLGIDVLYDSEVRELIFDEGRCRSVVVAAHGGSEEIRAKAFVTASGGFQADREWLKAIWGPPAENFLIRGTPYDTGHILRVLLDHGARSVGDPSQCHAIATDARSPRFDSGIVTRVDSLTFGIVVNRHAARFYDEGEDFWPKRYAIWGRLIAAEPDQIAFSIFDSKSLGAFIPPVFPPIEAPSIRELAVKLEIDPDALDRTVTAFNAAARPGTYNHAVLDDCSTQGLTPPKSHWARKLDEPPYYCYPLRPGITFTYFGVTVDGRARIVREDDRPIENVFAAGEIMSGNILGQGYLAGFGMSIGTVFGRIAGAEAARQALS
jgi:tricarballylate dehydrogenase